MSGEAYSELATGPHQAWARIAGLLFLEAGASHNLAPALNY